MFEFQDYLRAPSSVQLLIELGEQLGITPHNVLTGTGLNLSRLNDVNGVVTPDEEISVINHLIELLSPHTAGLGLLAGFKHQLTTYGILGYALMSSATGLDAMKLVQHYLPLTYTFVKINFHQENPQCIISFTEPAGLTSALQRFVVERAMAATARVIRDIYEDSFQLDAFHLQYSAPQHLFLQLPEQYLGTAIIFNQKNNVLKFNAAQLNTQMPHANPNTAAMCERLCKELIRQRHTTLTTTMIVRDFLMNAPTGTLLKLNHIADRLHSSERTLKRRLQEENTTFRQIQNEALHQRANDLLSGNLTLTQVAEHLGFSDLSTFSQAYKRWTGIAPSQFQKRIIN
ncbi:AraC family transcriptional regulator [Acinetobacter sp. C26M]|uniref:AraC family transcriptional regulator n=1 Tax=unclassified Acinetobacter TaxID=196816 RepID=UPI002036BC4C|nr:MULTISPECIES: AraC family transcriptional regulator [unclassified Acinetobacter]USA48216.1 AraC family transcriptional regulator [Acinetobacter sp. C26M]USA51696.1 AraC family transcriptional regulator [Acinetobacter sp. C26G]